MSAPPMTHIAVVGVIRKQRCIHGEAKPDGRCESKTKLALALNLEDDVNEEPDVKMAVLPLCGPHLEQFIVDLGKMGGLPEAQYD